MKLVLLEWARFVNRCIWSWQGVAEIWRTEASFRTWVLINLISAIFAVMVDLTGAERALILSLGVLILAMELMNSAIERAIDYISEDIHPLAKAAKDAGSAAVAVTAVGGGIAWLVILIG
ncbi:diacylglycerol kinase [uncultured Litoreibacter sp.]|uniref:diacylglycerol kinase n=1 Tax=uncultured Litoreibacter sp. TaxID=1392394 RepID=UPI002609A559|nr:diacylglycerol kinase [uncultured Litoreibacter sp.]